MKYIKNEDNYFGLINGNKVCLKYYKYNNKFYPNQDKLLEEIKSTENINNIDVNNYIFKIK